MPVDCQLPRYQAELTRPMSYPDPRDLKPAAMNLALEKLLAVSRICFELSK